MSIWVPIIPFLIGSIFCIEIAVHLGLTTKTEDEEIRKSRKNFGFAFTFFLLYLFNTICNLHSKKLFYRCIKYSFSTSHVRCYITYIRCDIPTI